MSEPKFTKGEWVISPTYAEILDSEVNSICIITGKGKSQTENDANEKLICAAPDLYRACEKALWDVERLNKQLWSEGKHGYTLMEQELREALSKATL